MLLDKVLKSTQRMLRGTLMQLKAPFKGKRFPNYNWPYWIEIEGQSQGHIQGHRPMHQLIDDFLKSRWLNFTGFFLTL